jgi:hypothetical protein
LTFWIDVSSAPARITSSLTLVLSIVTFNLTVSNDLPKVNYNTLLDWYVWNCFLFTIFAVAEFGLVHHCMYLKIFNNNWFSGLLDDFCAHVVTVMWILSNLLFWPIFKDDDALTGFVYSIMVAYFGINVVRFAYNWRYEKRGTAMYLAFYHWIMNNCNREGIKEKLAQA